MGWLRCNKIFKNSLASLIRVGFDEKKSLTFIHIFFCKGNGKTSQSGAQNKHVRIEGTNYYFDAKTNQQGRYMSISEVKGNSRSSILVPQSSWDSFYDGLDDSIKKVGTYFR